MHSKKTIEEFSDKLPKLALAMIQENIEEASKIIRDFVTCDDFVFMNYQLTDQYGGDNSIDLAAYWKECHDFISQYAPHMLPKKHGF